MDIRARHFFYFKSEDEMDWEKCEANIIKFFDEIAPEAPLSQKAIRAAEFIVMMKKLENGVGTRKLFHILYDDDPVV